MYKETFIVCTLVYFLFGLTRTIVGRTTIFESDITLLTRTLSRSGEFSYRTNTLMCLLSL